MATRRCTTPSTASPPHAARAEGDGHSAEGLRDGSIIWLMSDTLARISEATALRCSDVEPETTTNGGTVHNQSEQERPARGRRDSLHRAGDVRRDQTLLGGGRPHYWAAVPPDAAQRPQQRRGARRRQHPKDRAPASRGRDRCRGADRWALAAGGKRARVGEGRRQRGRTAAGGRMAVACYAGDHSPRGRRPRPGRAPLLPGGAVGGTNRVPS